MKNLTRMLDQLLPLAVVLLLASSLIMGFGMFKLEQNVDQIEQKVQNQHVHSADLELHKDHIEQQYQAAIAQLNLFE